METKKVSVDIEDLSPRDEDGNILEEGPFWVGSLYDNDEDKEIKNIDQVVETLDELDNIVENIVDSYAKMLGGEATFYDTVWSEWEKKTTAWEYHITIS